MGQTAAIRLLIAFGANVNAKADDGSTPLDDAVAQGHAATAELLRAAVEASLGLERGERWLVQLGLAATGYDLGSIDGLFGPRTRKAIRQFQRDLGVEDTGYLDSEQSTVLLAVGEQAVRRGREWRESTPVSGFRDCAKCPELVVVPSGSYMMGSPSDEVGRYDDEGPVHRVTFAEPFAVGVTEVTRGEFAQFVRETGHWAPERCSTYENGSQESRPGRSWPNPGFSQTDLHPVVCVSWEDTQAYADWLSRKTGKDYRLLSESEWEYVARAGTQMSRYWGRSERGQCRHANGVDESAKRRYRGWTVASCDDGYVHTSPVGSYALNGYGLHDVLGNVWEWVEDCWSERESYAGAPGDGDAWRSGSCNIRVIRGGSWKNAPRDLRSALRFRTAIGDQHSAVGFRIARALK